MKTLRATAKLVVRDLPAGADTGKRLEFGQTVEAHGESYDGKWTFVSPPAGWASSAYLSPPQGLTVPALAGATGLVPTEALRWLPFILEAATRFGFTAPTPMAMWLAQCGHESMGFTQFVENLNYSAAALRSTWPSHFPTDQIAGQYARQPERIANRAYGDRLGNGPEASGDGWRYRGRGLIQITGKDNYRVCGDALGVDLVSQPELVATERFAALSAGWFWRSHGLNGVADDVVAATRRINGGLNGLSDRTARWQKAKLALGVT